MIESYDVRNGGNGVETRRQASGPPGSRAMLPWMLLVFLPAVGCSDDGTGPGEDTGSWVDVEVGRAHACALTSTGRVYCWGSNSLGQAGVPGIHPVLRPTLVGTERRFEQLSAGGDNTCGLTEGGRIFCWGSNGLGQLGGGILDAFRPVPVSGDVSWSFVSVGTYHVCGLDDVGEPYCWGGDRWDVVLGYRASATCSAPHGEPRWPCSGAPKSAGVGTGFDWVTTGLYHTCIGGEGVPAACWGVDDLGQLGADAPDTCANNDALHPTTRPCSRTPMQPFGPSMAVVAPGTTHACGVGSAGGAYCWGGLQLNFGQVGNGSVDGTTEPVPVSGGGAFESVVTSHENHIRTFSCGIDAAGQGYCWGANRFGQLGVEGTDGCESAGQPFPCSPIPVPIGTSEALEVMDLGIEFGCGLTEGGEILCWGYNEEGQLGDGTTTNRSAPAPVAEPA